MNVTDAYNRYMNHLFNIGLYYDDAKETMDALIKQSKQNISARGGVSTEKAIEYIPKLLDYYAEKGAKTNLKKRKGMIGRIRAAFGEKLCPHVLALIEFDKLV